MCYKDELQKKNAAKLQKRFEKDGVPEFMRKYFVNIESKAGAINYWIAIKDLLRWTIDNRIIKKDSISEIMPEDLCEIESEDVTMYLRQKEDSGMSPTTLETRKQIFSSFWKYLERTNKCPVKTNIIKDVSYKGISSGNNLIRKLPTEKQLEDMEEKIMKKKDYFIRTRNLMIFRLLKGTGLRESELAGLDLSDLFLDEDMPYITILGKGKYRTREARIVYLTGSAANAIKGWLKYRSTISRLEGQNAVFINKNGERLNEYNIQSIFKTYGYGTTPHMLRHWFATVMANTGNLAFAQQQLGHTSVNTTINNYANGAYGMKDVLLNM